MVYPCCYCTVIVYFTLMACWFSTLNSSPESGLVYFQPPFTSMLGGDPIAVVGLCFETEVPSVTGTLETRDGATEELCCFIENASLVCYLPPVFHTGFVNISLNVDGQGRNYTGQFEISGYFKNKLFFSVTEVNTVFFFFSKFNVLMKKILLTFFPSVRWVNLIL